jgi:hypothetical protein
MVKSGKYVVKSSNFVVTVHTTLPIRTASQGVSFALYNFLFADLNLINSAYV